MSCQDYDQDDGDDDDDDSDGDDEDDERHSSLAAGRMMTLGTVIVMSAWPVEEKWQRFIGCGVK